MNYIDQLNSAQKKAVEKTNGPILIIAGAGAGKTKTVTTRIVNLIQNSVQPESILAITFTNKAAKEMRERVQSMIEGDRDLYEVIKNRHPFISTFHSLGVYVLKNYGHTQGINKNFTILDRDDSRKKVKEILVKKGHDPKKVEPSKVLNTISKNKGENITLAEYTTKVLSGHDGFLGETVRAVWAVYDAELRKEKNVDFDDLLTLPVKIIKEHPEIKEKLNNQWKYIHVDEYQDTNPIQYELCKLLAGEDKNIVVVGDADQTIYSWRGANISHILEFEHDFPGTEVVLLEENYRSTGNIIEAANNVIEKNIYRKKKNLFTQKESGAKIELYTGFDEVDESRYVIGRVKSLIQEGVEPKDIAVLYRANFQSRTLEESCLMFNVPYQVLGVKFFERKEIKDMISYLKAAVNRDSITDIKRTINTPARGIGAVSLIKIVEDRIHDLTQATQVKVREYFALLDVIEQKTKTEKLSEVFKYIFKNSGIEKSYLTKSEDDLEKLENIKELISLTAKYDGFEPEEALELFLEETSLMSDQDELDKKDQHNKVRLMTVHASKGLEYDYVFIVGMEESLFPYERMNESGSDRDEEEERRLFYVALTRAKKKLHLSNAIIRTIFGARQVRTVSSFIKDINENLLEHNDNTSYNKNYGSNTQNNGGKRDLLDLSEIDW
jgi:DNA helicase-2/ATP-dependent DNA helicase PcrA